MGNLGPNVLQFGEVCQGTTTPHVNAGWLCPFGVGSWCVYRLRLEVFEERVRMRLAWITGWQMVQESYTIRKLDKLDDDNNLLFLHRVKHVSLLEAPGPYVVGDRHSRDLPLSQEATRTLLPSQRSIGGDWSFAGLLCLVHLVNTGRCLLWSCRCLTWLHLWSTAQTHSSILLLRSTPAQNTSDRCLALARATQLSLLCSSSLCVVTCRIAP